MNYVGISTNLTVLAFMKDGTPAPNARNADQLIVNWNILNMTSGPLKLTFPDDALFRLTLSKGNGTVVWQQPEPKSAKTLGVTIPPGDRYTLPPKNPPPGQDGLVDLAAILAALDPPIAAEEELELLFQPQAAELRSMTGLGLWR